MEGDYFMSKFYTEEQIINVIENELNGTWYLFIKTKEGVWCYRRNKPLYKKLKEQYRKVKHNYFYSEEDLIDAIQKKYADSWRVFARNKEGKWCESNNKKLYEKLQKQYSGKNIDLREQKYHLTFEKKIHNYFKRKSLDYKLEHEVMIGEYKDVRNRIDFLLEIKDYGLTLPIELKHDLSSWTQKEIQDQKERYDYCLRDKGLETYFVSPKGKYGFSEKEFFFILENLIKNEEIYLANSLDWIKNINLEELSA